MIWNHCTGDLDETDDIQNNMDETSWQNGASFHVKMFVKYEIGAGSFLKFEFHPNSYFLR